MNTLGIIYIARDWYKHLHGYLQHFSYGPSGYLRTALPVDDR